MGRTYHVNTILRFPFLWKKPFAQNIALLSIYRDFSFLYPWIRKDGNIYRASPLSWWVSLFITPPTWSTTTIYKIHKGKIQIHNNTNTNKKLSWVSNTIRLSWWVSLFITPPIYKIHKQMRTKIKKKAGKDSETHKYKTIMIRIKLFSLLNTVPMFWYLPKESKSLLVRAKVFRI